MIELQDRQILDDGTVLFSDRAIIELLYSGRTLDSVLAVNSEEIELHNATDQFLDTGYGNIEQADGAIYGDVDWFSHWMTPEPYASMDVTQVCWDKCRNDAERQRVAEEMLLFEQRNMIPVLLHLLFLVDHWREQGIVWGVGRGSSVSSLILHLIGINRINPLEFDLGIDEFLK